MRTQTKRESFIELVERIKKLEKEERKLKKDPCLKLRPRHNEYHFTLYKHNLTRIENMRKDFAMNRSALMRMAIIHLYRKMQDKNFKNKMKLKSLQMYIENLPIYHEKKKNASLLFDDILQDL